LGLFGGLVALRLTRPAYRYVDKSSRDNDDMMITNLWKTARVERMEKEEVQIGFRGTEEYRAELQKEALNRNIKVQQMIREAVDQYLGKPPCVRKGTARDDKLVLLLERVLTGISPKDRQALTTILEVFERSHRLKHGNPSREPSGDNPGGNQPSEVNENGRG
jgi:hypothetical protein